MFSNSIYDELFGGLRNFAYYENGNVSNDDDGNIVYELDVPGFNKDNLSVEMSGNILHIKGERGKRKIEKKLELANYLGDAKASIKDGILKLTFQEKDKRKLLIE